MGVSINNYIQGRDSEECSAGRRRDQKGAVTPTRPALDVNYGTLQRRFVCQ